MPELTFKEQILEAIPCIDVDCDGAGNIPVPDGNGDWEAQQCQYCFEVRFPTIEKLEKIFSQAIDRQMKEVLKCFPEDYEMDRDVFIGFENYRDQLLDNLKKAKLI